MRGQLEEESFISFFILSDFVVSRDSYNCRFDAVGFFIEQTLFGIFVIGELDVAVSEFVFAGLH